MNLYYRASVCNGLCKLNITDDSLRCLIAATTKISGSITLIDDDNIFIQMRHNTSPRKLLMTRVVFDNTNPVWSKRFFQSNATDLSFSYTAYLNDSLYSISSFDQDENDVIFYQLNATNGDLIGSGLVSGSELCDDAYDMLVYNNQLIITIR